ncbi:MAG: hypothetical protein N2201_00310 [candidate division WOR-3 bacterium]|nr:hypothetical protein [candidate division WOR-3 bacterium]
MSCGVRFLMRNYSYANEVEIKNYREIGSFIVAIASLEPHGTKEILHHLKLEDLIR